MNPYEAPNSQLPPKSSNEIDNKKSALLGLLVVAFGTVISSVMNVIGIVATAFIDVSWTRAYDIYSIIVPAFVTTLVVSVHSCVKNPRLWQFLTYGVNCVLLIIFNRWLLLQIAASV